VLFHGKRRPESGEGGQAAFFTNGKANVCQLFAVDNVKYSESEH
jgi:hypothetical protein